jgi:xanthine dehydrogenase accessory factor
MDFFDRLSVAKKEGKPVALCIVVETIGAVPRHAGSKMLVYASGRTEGSVGGGELELRTINAALESLKDGRSRIVEHSLSADAPSSAGVCGGEVKVYIEPQVTQPILLILGAGHVGQSVAKFGQLLDFRVIVSDDRTELCTSQVKPGKIEFLPMPMADIPAHMEINERVYIVGVTRGSSVDVEGLGPILEGSPAYIGLLGSKNRWAATKQGLMERGVSAEKIAKIKSPIGIYIKAETPDEIAISILAEVIEKLKS